MFSSKAICNIAPYITSRDPDYQRTMDIKSWSKTHPDCNCLVCIPMEPIKAPVWDEPVSRPKMRVFEMKEPKADFVCIRPASSRSPQLDTACRSQQPVNIASSSSGETPVSKGAEKVPKDQCEPMKRPQLPAYIPEHFPGRLPAIGEVAEHYQVINDKVYRVCLCTRRNGLQDTCPLTGCGGQPPCLTIPTPSCEPSGIGKKIRQQQKIVSNALCPPSTR